MMSKKWMALMLALVMVLSTLAGCSGGTIDDKKSTDAPEQTTEGPEGDETEGAEQTTEAPKNEITYPLEGVSPLEFFVMGGWNLSGDYEDYNQSPFHIGLSTQTGVPIEWSKPPIGTNGNVALNLLIQGEVDELPHMIYGVSPDQVRELYDEELIYDLTPYLEEYAPDYWAMINSDEVWFKEVADIEDRVLGFNFIRDEANSTFRGTVIRQDWLDECGLEMPRTLDELENVLVKFKEKYGAYLSVSKASFFEELYGIVSGSGLYGFMGLDFYVDENGKIQCAQLQEEWKEFVTRMKRWYDMDLIDPDFTSIKNKGSAAKVADGKVGVIVTVSSQIQGYIQTAAEAGSSANWVAMEPMRTEVGAPTTFIHYTAPINNTGAVITKRCSEEELITALKLLNYGYSEEGIIYYNYGIKDEDYTVDENGEIWFTDKVYNAAEGVFNVDKYTGMDGTAPGYQTERHQWLKTDEASREGMEIWAANSIYPEHRLPILDYTADEEDRRADIQTRIETYATPMQYKFILGEESLDNYDAYINELYALGLQDVIDIIQTAYDREYKD